MKRSLWPVFLRLFAALLLSVAAAAPHAVHAQGGGAPSADGVRVQVFVDQRRIAAAKKQIGQDGGFPVYGYRLQPGPQALELRLDSPELMRRWKGDFVLGSATKATFEDANQFLPVMLVLDVSNESGAPLQVVSSSLEVVRSRSELQPFIDFSFWDEGIVQGFFDITNHGWGRAENAQIEFAFGREQPVTERFGLRLGTLGAVEVTPIRALTALVPPLPQLLDQPPKCPSNKQVPACLQRLMRAVPTGRLADIAYTRADMVLTRMTGRLAYQWRDASGQMQPREHPVSLELLLFRFDTGEGAEMGGAGPEEMGFQPIVLQLDREMYRLPLPYRPRLGPGQNQRFQLAVVAPKASSHQFRVVLETSDGRRVATPPLDLLYFVPRMDVGEARQVR